MRKVNTVTFSALLLVTSQKLQKHIRNEPSRKYAHTKNNEFSKPNLKNLHRKKLSLSYSCMVQVVSFNAWLLGLRYPLRFSFSFRFSLFICQVTLARRQRRDLSVFESSCHLPPVYHFKVESPHCPFNA